MEKYSINEEIQDISPISHSLSQECDQHEEKSNLDDVSENAFNEYEYGVNRKESEILQMNPSLRQFDLLDEIGESDLEGSNIVESNSDVSGADFEELLTDDSKMLKGGFPDKFKRSNSKEPRVKTKQKIVLEDIGHNHFEILPEDWVKINHSSGMPVYLHNKTRVCTMSKPYYLGPGSSRDHDVPLSAIPCLQYRRASEVEKKMKEDQEKKKKLNQDPLSGIELMSVKIETVEENKATQSLKAQDLNKYCRKIFNFKTIDSVAIKSRADKRKFGKMSKNLEIKQRPTLPSGTKFLKFASQNSGGTVSGSKGEWIMNPNGKTFVCILHEYVQRAIKKHPTYQFKEIKNPATPFSATVFIEEIEYGFGLGASKKQAKGEAAKAACEVLLPEIKDKIEQDGEFDEMHSGITNRSEDGDISIFDQIKVEDPRVTEFCTKTSEPLPYSILLTCLSHNAGIGEIKFGYEMNPKSVKPDDYRMTVGNHKATVSCKNKQEGKQRAAQAILQALHPNITYWGSLLRMYGNRSIKNMKEKKREEKEIIQLQSKATLNKPNYAILNKLKTKLIKLKNKRMAIPAKGTFILPKEIILPSLSCTDIGKVNLGL